MVIMVVDRSIGLMIADFGIAMMMQLDGSPDRSWPPIAAACAYCEMVNWCKLLVEDG